VETSGYGPTTYAPPADPTTVAQQAAAAQQGLPGGDAVALEVSRRVNSILEAVEREAAQLREKAKQDAERYTDYAKRHADGLVAERMRRISELSDALVARSEAVLERLDDAEPVRQRFENLVRALGDTAQRLAQDAQNGAAFTPPTFEDAMRDAPPSGPILHAGTLGTPADAPAGPAWAARPGSAADRLRSPERPRERSSGLDPDGCFGQDPVRGRGPSA
jgi:hypothetical protein